MKYGVIVQYEKDDLEKIQIEAARIAIGTTKLVSIEHLYTEIGWEKLEIRRKNKKVTLLYNDSSVPIISRAFKC